MHRVSSLLLPLWVASWLLAGCDLQLGLFGFGSLKHWGGLAHPTLVEGITSVQPGGGGEESGTTQLRKPIYSLFSLKLDVML
jgi:hypothetical protein